MIVPMARTVRQLGWLTLAFALAACGVAPPGRLLLIDTAGTLDEAGLARPASPLMARGITLALVLAESGDDSGADFAGRLAAAGMLRGGQIAPDAIGVYVSLSPRYSELRAGARWSDYLPPPTLERIRQGALNPALREGRTADAFASALSAVEGEIQAGKEREWAGLWITFGMIGVFLLGLLVMSNKDNIANTWSRSPAGKLVSWAWGRTPAGRAAARQELLRALAAERGRIDDLDRQVREKLKLLGSPRDFQETLDELSARQAALLQSEGLAELRALRSAYDSWLTDVDDLISTRDTKQARSEAARRQLARLRADMRRAEQPTRHQRKRHMPHPVSAEDLARLAGLEARMTELDTSEAKLARLWHTAQDRQVWLHQLGTAYRKLEADALALWKTACPEAYAAEELRRRAAQGDSGATESSSAPSYPSGASSSPSDWSSDYGSGGESRAGGDW
jgi:hypothetical protein